MKRICSFLLLASLTPAVSAVENQFILDRWKPIVIFAGNGDSQLAINNLRGINEMQSLMADHATFDPQSQQFIDELWGSIEDFNLSRFYDILPEQNGEWRELRVKGRREGGEYCYVDATGQNFNAGIGKAALGDSSLLVRSKRIYNKDTGKVHFLMGGEWQIGWGSYSWQSFRTTVNESVKLLSADSKTDIGNQQKFVENEIDKMNVSLGAEDREILAPLWASFPNLWNLYASIGHVEDIVVQASNSSYKNVKASDGVKEVSIVVAVDPEKIEDNYPAIGAYLDRIDDLLVVNLDLYSVDGKVLSIELDTTNLKAKINMLLKGDGLIPVDNGVAKLDKIVHFHEAPLGFMAVVNAKVDIFGVTTEVNNIRSTVGYGPDDNGLHVDIKMNTLPDVKVSGMALGFMPTKLIDAFLPTNIDKIILEFMEVAINGNEGKGIEASIDLQNTTTPGVTNMQLSGNVEALDSLLARIAVAVVNQRLLPSEKQNNELIALLKSSREAFNQDLALYEKITQSMSVARLQ